jgi:hypothetical protein
MASARSSYLPQLSAAAAWAGITAFVWYAFGAVPLHLAVSGQLGLTTEQTSSWIFIVWFSGAVATIWLSLQFRQPIPITWTNPGGINGVRLEFPASKYWPGPPVEKSSLTLFPQTRRFSAVYRGFFTRDGGGAKKAARRPPFR